MNREELAWAAGFFDGEGTVTAPRGRGAAQLQVCQQHLGTLERFRGAVGVGRIYGPYDYRQHGNRRPVYQFAAGSFEGVQAIAALLWRWLSEPKREQFTRVLHWERARTVNLRMSRKARDGWRKRRAAGFEVPV